MTRCTSPGASPSSRRATTTTSAGVSPTVSATWIWITLVLFLLVYGVFAVAPTELVIRRADGRTVYSESLAQRVAENTEFCEGFAEPS